jgi:hypothetical protein
MAYWLQHLLVLLIVLASAGAVLWQIVQSLRGKKSRVGSCCAKGCASEATSKPAKEQIVFIPVEMLGRPK